MLVVPHSFTARSGYYILRKSSTSQSCFSGMSPLFPFPRESSNNLKGKVQLSAQVQDVDFPAKMTRENDPSDHQTPPGTIIIQQKGKLVTSGTRSLMELLPSGDIIKTPWAGDIHKADCQKEISIKAGIYEELGNHPCLVKLRHGMQQLVP